MCACICQWLPYAHITDFKTHCERDRRVILIRRPKRCCYVVVAKSRWVWIGGWMGGWMGVVLFIACNRARRTWYTMGAPNGLVTYRNLPVTVRGKLRILQD